MDVNSDFRSLLYNIICCLLTQDEQILGSPSVTKMIDVIRTHLESASRFYSIAAAKTLNTPQQPQQLTTPRGYDSCDKGRKNSFGSQNSSSSTATTTASLSSATLNQHLHETSAGSPLDRLQQRDLSQPTSTKPKRSSREKPVEFWRVSSVSYEDEQLINDLCTGCQVMSLNDGASQHCNDLTGDGQTSATPLPGAKESPWSFEELSAESKHYHTSQSSLERELTNTYDLMQDAACDGIYAHLSQAYEFMFKNSLRGPHKKRHSDITEFKPMHRLSYVSSDDNVTGLCYDDSGNQTTMTYDDESHSQLHSRRHSTDQRSHQEQPVDVASRRAELEWILNKLINIELKYIWLTSKDTLRRAIRKVGIPNEIRGKVWLILIQQMIGSKYDAAKLLSEADKTIQTGLANADEETQGILKQIDLDVNRTMPGHKMFDDGAEGGVKLRRILVAYSIHINRAIAYCQGFNFIVALLLSVLDGNEEKALRGFVCIVDHIFPSKFYFDHYLTGARADQFLLADFICDQLIKNPTTAERKMVEGVTSSITLNWFISLFHGAVPTLTRLTILDHFMLEGVKALFRFTMAILYLAFQVTPPSSCEVYATIRNTAKDMYDIKLLLSIVDQIKLPKDSYFAVRRSFYMVQSSFNSDQFYMQSLSNDASLQMVSNKPLSVQQLPHTKQPAMSLISHNVNSNQNASKTAYGGPRICTSSDKTKVCIQTLGKLGRSHLKIMDANVRSNERSLISPLRNCFVIGIANCGKNVLMARQASKRGYKTFREQDLMFHVHEICSEIFDGFYLESSQLAIISTHSAEIIKIDVSRCYADSQMGSTETISLRDSQSFIGDHEKMRLRLVSIDALTNLLWVHIECEDSAHASQTPTSPQQHSNLQRGNQRDRDEPAKRFMHNNPFWSDSDENLSQSHQESRNASSTNQYQRKILIIDIITFDIFSAFTLHQSFGDITSMRTSLLAFCQLANPMSNQFSSRIVRIGPTGRYEHLLSFSDVVDFMISVPEAGQQDDGEGDKKPANVSSAAASQRYSSIKRLLPRSFSLNYSDEENHVDSSASSKAVGGTLSKYYSSLMRGQSTACELNTQSKQEQQNVDNSTKDNIGKQHENCSNKQCSLAAANGLPKSCRALINSYLVSDADDVTESNYMPVNMVFIFRNGKIALFEFTESYAIHTRESQLDRYDYAKVIDVAKNGEDFIVTILTVFDKLIKVVI